MVGVGDERSEVLSFHGVGEELIDKIRLQACEGGSVGWVKDY